MSLPSEFFWWKQNILFGVCLQSIVMRTSLSKSEFASALGMKADAVFVKKMFNIVDKDSDGRISFQVEKYELSNILIDKHELKCIQLIICSAGIPGHSSFILKRCNRRQTTHNIRYVRQ